MRTVVLPLSRDPRVADVFKRAGWTMRTRRVGRRWAVDVTTFRGSVSSCPLPLLTDAVDRAVDMAMATLERGAVG